MCLKFWRPTSVRAKIRDYVRGKREGPHAFLRNYRISGVSLLTNGFRYSALPLRLDVSSDPATAISHVNR